MLQNEECVSRYRRLLNLLENDAEEIAQGLQGELLTAYRSVLEKEKDRLTDALRDMERTN